MVELLPAALARLEQSRAGLAKWGLFPDDEPVRYIKTRTAHDPKPAGESHDRRRGQGGKGRTYIRDKRDDDAYGGN